MQPRGPDGQEFRLLAMGAMSRVAAALALVAVLLALWGGVVWPVWSWHSDNEQRLHETLDTIGRLKAVVEFGASHRTVFESASAASYADDFLSGTEDALIMAHLQTRLRELVVSRNCEFSGARTLPPKSANGLTYLGVKIHFKGDLRDVQRIVHAIETTAPLLFVERVQFRRDERRLLPVGTIQEVVPLLQAELDVYGAKWPGVPAGPEPRPSP